MIGNVAFCIPARQQDSFLRKCAKNLLSFSGGGDSSTGRVSADAAALASQGGEEGPAPTVSLPSY